MPTDDPSGHADGTPEVIPGPMRLRRQAKAPDRIDNWNDRRTPSGKQIEAIYVERLDGRVVVSKEFKDKPRPNRLKKAAAKKEKLQSQRDADSALSARDIRIDFQGFHLDERGPPEIVAAQRAQLKREDTSRDDKLKKAVRKHNSYAAKGRLPYSKGLVEIIEGWAVPFAEGIAVRLAAYDAKDVTLPNHLSNVTKLCGAPALAHIVLSTVIPTWIAAAADEEETSSLGRKKQQAQGKVLGISAASIAVGRTVRNAFITAAAEYLDPVEYPDPLKQRSFEHLENMRRARDGRLALAPRRPKGDVKAALVDIARAVLRWGTEQEAAVGRVLLDIIVQTSGGLLRIVGACKCTGECDCDGTPKWSEHNKRAEREIVPSPALLEHVQEAIRMGVLRLPVGRSMICPPLPWAGGTGGGYLTGIGGDKRLVAKAGRRRKIPMDHLTDGGAPKVERAVNFIQAVPFRVDLGLVRLVKGVDDARRASKGSNIEVENLPDHHGMKKPKKPASGKKKKKKEMTPEERAEWRRYFADFKVWAGDEATKLSLGNLITESLDKLSLAPADALKNTSLEADGATQSIWFPASCDFRGRIFTNGGIGPSPQGSALQRYSLRFAKGKPIGEAHWKEKALITGPKWLACQVAKAFGHGKKTWLERQRWTLENAAEIRDVAKHPHLFLRGALRRREPPRERLIDVVDNPWSAIAAAREWTAYLNSGCSKDFVTTLPIFIDGSCNGLQHFAALSRNAELAGAVNVTVRDHGEPPQDVYRTVLDDLAEAIRNAAKRNPAPAAARAWARLLETEGGKLPRSLAKKVVMTKPYGAKSWPAIQSVSSYTREVHAKGKLVNYAGLAMNDDELAAARRWLIKALQDALKRHVQPADTIMNWMQDLAALLEKNKVETGPLVEMPSGWLWNNDYFDYRSKPVDVSIMTDDPEAVKAQAEARNKKEKDARREKEAGDDDADDLSSSFVIKGDRIVIRKEVTSKPHYADRLKGISPNFIHGLDASALVLAVNRIIEANASKPEGAAITSVICIHDCVAGLAPDMNDIASAVREGFVEVHKSNPLLALRDAVKAALPKEARDDPILSDTTLLGLINNDQGDLGDGSFDLEVVLRSPYFFH